MMATMTGDNDVRTYEKAPLPQSGRAGEPVQPGTPPSEVDKAPERGQKREEEKRHAEGTEEEHSSFLSDLHHKLDEAKKRTEETVKVRGARVVAPAK